MENQPFWWWLFPLQKRWGQNFYGFVPPSKATSWESSADYMASWRPAVDLEAAASAADEDELTWRSRREASGWYTSED